MFQNSRINIILRIVCLITFMLVIIFNRSFITLTILTVFFFAFTRNDRNIFLFWWRIITIIAFLISYFTNYSYILRIVLIVGLAYYFLIVPYSDSETSDKPVIIDKYFLRFKNKDKEGKDVIDMNLINAIYVTVHLFILFVTIMVG